MKKTDKPKKVKEKPQNMKAQSKAQAVAAQTTQQVTQTFTSIFSNPLKSVGTKLFLIIFISIIACVLVVGQMAYSKTKDIVEDKVSSASFQTIVQASANLDIVLKTYEDLSMQIMLDKEFHTLVAKLEDSTDAFDLFEAEKNLGERLQNVVMGNKTIIGAYLLPLEDKLPIITYGTASVAAAPDLAKSEWFEETKNSKGAVNWIETQPTGFGTADKLPAIGLSRQMNDTTTNAASYILLLELNLADIRVQYEDVTLGDGSKISLVDSNNKYIAAQDESLIGKGNLVKLNIDPEGSLKEKASDGEEVLSVFKTLDTVDWKLVGTIPVDQLVKDAGVINKMTWLIALVAMLIAIAIGMLVIRTVAMPLMAMRNLMNEGERGNLTVRSNMKNRQDEIGQLGDSFNKMMIQITALAKQTTQSAEDVLLTAGELTDVSKKTAISAREISVATEEIASGASSLAVEAERGSDLTGNINVQMKTVMEATGHMVESAGEVEKASQQGTAYMGLLIQKTGMTEEMTRSMVEKVDSLKLSTGSIVKILDVLNNLTKQTNILSLNATIEAARAGAAGKGFMVVADEIRKLADQSRQSIDVVGQITETIMKQIEETVTVLSDAYPLFQEQIGSVKEANQLFLTVQGQMGEFVQKLDSVTNSISMLEQSQVVLTEAMGNVSAVAQQSSATSEEVASLSTEQLSISNGLVSLSEKLDAVSRGLKESLSRFKID